MREALLTFLCALAAGTLSAWGVGGGTLLLLGLTLLLEVEQRQAQTLNLLFFLPAAAAALLFHRRRGALDAAVLRRAALPGALAALAGAAIAALVDVSLLRRPFGKLSGGQRRRVDIARALVGSPSLLVWDEPTTGLDPKTRQTVWEIVRRLQKDEGITVFLTTHYMEEADGSDRVVIIDDGAVAAVGTPVQLKNAYSRNYLRLYGDAPALAERARALGLDARAEGGACVAAVASAEEARAFLLRNPELCRDFEFVKGNMDDVFLAVTGKQLQGGNAV